MTGAPAGEFVLAPSERPIVLLSAGVGVTPFVSMLHELTDAADRRPIWFIHGARNRREHAFSDEVRELASRNPALRVHIAYSRPSREDSPGMDFDSRGRVDGELLDGLLPTLDAEFYLCGPVGFMATLGQELAHRGVPAARIHSESFSG